ncbi:hypothetical protein LCGC14_1934090 [marine sediment metagenome]|uniref:Uncharacterized protein n=1 Tax=marine sediment metagenome TaxID=412755 RepID=A0A0F9FMM2_9ZZZZ
MINTSIKSFYTFNKTHKRYDHSPLLHLHRYGYTEIGCEVYDKGEDPKPIILVKEFIENRNYKDVVYRMTTHTYNQPWIEIYAKFE